MAIAQLPAAALARPFRRRERRSLAASVVARDDGQLELRIALPDAAAIEALLQLVARAALRVPERRPRTAAADRAG